MDAKAYELTLLKKLHQGGKVQAKSLTLREARDRFLASRSRARPAKEITRLLDHAVAFFGENTPLRSVTSDRVAAYKASLMGAMSQHTGRPLKASTINRPLQVLRCLLRTAFTEWESIHSVPRFKLERESQGRLRWLELDEETKLLTACKNSKNKYLADIVPVAANEGMRQDEIMGLTWDRVSFSRNVIQLEITKSGRRREIPLRDCVYRALAALPEPHEGLVWPSRVFPRIAWEEALKRAKVTDFTFHDLRHHFASWFMMRGGSLMELKEILGHADIKMTLRYAHLAPGYLQSAMLKTEQAHPVSQEPVSEPNPGTNVVRLTSTA